MDDLVAWLRGQFDEDERVVLRVLRFSRDSYAHGSVEEWVAERRVKPPFLDFQEVHTERPGTVQRAVVRLDSDIAGADADHIARFASPRRVLRDVHGKREMLNDVVALPRFRRDPILKLLAVPYADCPGYCDGWRP